jgi:uncharacterized protein with von Willebrand factor type A (vWA) domain
MRQEQSVQLAASIVEFCRYLRTCGFSADTRQTMSALEAARTIEVTNRQFFLSALQATLCSNREEWEQFAQLFQTFWAESQPRPRSVSGEYAGPSKGNSPEQKDSSSVFLDRPGNQCGAQDGTSKAAHGASAQQRLKKVDFSELPSEDLKVQARLQKSRVPHRPAQNHSAKHRAWR